MIVLALDLGTKTGWALSRDRGDKSLVECGTWVLATPNEIKIQGRRGDDRRKDIRVVRLFDNIRHICMGFKVDLIVFEDVQFIKTVMQGQLWAGLRSAVWLQPDIRIECVPVSTLKKFATGWHTAKKHQMKAALQRENDIKVKNLEKIDDNAVDAVYLLLYAWKHFSG